MSQAPFSGPLQELYGKINRIFQSGLTFDRTVVSVLNVGALDGNLPAYEESDNKLALATNAAAGAVPVTSPILPPGTYDVVFMVSGDIQAAPRQWQLRLMTSGGTSSTLNKIRWENSVAGPNIAWPFAVTFLTPKVFNIENSILANGTLSFRIWWKKRTLDT